MDKSRLALVVYKRTGFPLEEEDPAFALVELNRVALEELIDESAARIAERLDTLPERIRSSGNHLAAELATQGMQRVVEMLAESRRTIAADTEQAQRRIADHTAKLNEPLCPRGRGGDARCTDLFARERGALAMAAGHYGHGNRVLRLRLYWRTGYRSAQPFPTDSHRIEGSQGRWEKGPRVRPRKMAARRRRLAEHPQRRLARS
ncbi:MAG TPA: hypothetical protein VMQ45_00855 [Burkholderiaceae bacterium]|nr:hypothetical protein [Burkholderiaceae bacterium]